MTFLKNSTQKHDDKYKKEKNTHHCKTSTLFVSLRI